MLAASSRGLLDRDMGELAGRQGWDCVELKCLFPGSGRGLQAESPTLIACTTCCHLHHQRFIFFLRVLETIHRKE